MKQFEKKNFTIESVDEYGTFIGFASYYGNVDEAGEVVERGAFKNIDGTDVVLLSQHKIDCPIGLCKLADTIEGLLIEGQINLNVEKGREAHALLKQGALSGLSIGYRVKNDRYEHREIGGVKHLVRILSELDLLEVSVVTFPCNKLATVFHESVKSEECSQSENEIKVLEGISKLNSKMFAELIRIKRKEVF